VGVLLFYAATRLYGIVDFPIYFFCDEAQQANLAERLVDNGFRDDDGNLFPAYFQNVRVYNLGLSVWVHALPIAAFGKTIFTVRATSVMVGLLGAAALMLALKWFFATRLWWTGGLVMAALPAWFLHSRTAFEAAMMVGFYATFVLAYLLYREVSEWWLPAAVVCGAATFYSYSNGQGVMFVSCLLLLVVDWRYHWRVVRRHPGAAAAGLVAVLLVAAPYIRFRFFLHPEMMATHLDDLNSYWIEDIPLARKIGLF
jgi:4-amino-4-deoxy-L-arabinose transferase-like glycosyltransferase